MTYVWQSLLKPSHGPADTIPPAAMTESSWDILLTLFSEPSCNLELRKLAALASLSPTALNSLLADLEMRNLITGTRGNGAGELRATLTPGGRGLLGTYLAVCGELHTGAHH